MLDVHWTLTVHVPQLDALQQALLALGEQLVAELQGIKDAMVSLETQQAAGADAIAAQLTTIADEISQLNKESIAQSDLDALEKRVRDAATMAEQQAAQIRQNSQQIAGMVPDQPVPTP